jgi:hypothetical protein
LWLGGRAAVAGDDAETEQEYGRFQLADEHVHGFLERRVEVAVHDDLLKGSASTQRNEPVNGHRLVTSYGRLAGQCTRP